MAKKKKKQLTKREKRLARQLVQVDDKATEKNLKKKVVSKSNKKEKKRSSGIKAELEKADRTEKNIMKNRRLQSKDQERVKKAIKQIKERNKEKFIKPIYDGKPPKKIKPIYDGKRSELVPAVKNFKKRRDPDAKRDPALYTGPKGKKLKSLKDLKKVKKQFPKSKELDKKTLSLLDDAIKGKYKGPNNKPFTPTTEEKLKRILGEGNFKRIEKKVKEKKPVVKRPVAKRPVAKKPVTQKKAQTKLPTTLPEKKTEPTKQQVTSKKTAPVSERPNPAYSTKSPTRPSSFLKNDPIVERQKRAKTSAYIPAETGSKKPGFIAKQTYAEKLSKKRNQKIKEGLEGKATDFATEGSLQRAAKDGIDIAKDKAKQEINVLNEGKNVKIGTTAVKGAGGSTRVKGQDFDTGVEFKTQNTGRSGKIKFQGIDLNTLKGLTPVQRAKLGIDEAMFQNAIKNQINQAKGQTDKLNKGLMEGLNKVAKASTKDNALINSLLQSGRESVAQVEDYAQGRLKNLNENIEKTLNTIQDSNNQIQAITRQGIDPSRYFRNMDNFQAGLTAVSVSLGAYSSARLGQQNMALKMLNDSIDRDVKAQVTEASTKTKTISNRINLFKAKLKGHQDEREALIKTISDMGAAMTQKMKMVSELQPTREGQIKVLELGQKFKEGWDKKILDLYSLDLDQLEYQYGKIKDTKDQSVEVAKANQEYRYKTAKANQESEDKALKRDAETGVKIAEEKGRNKRELFKAQVGSKRKQAEINADLNKAQAQLKANRQSKLAELKSGERKKLQELISQESRARDTRRFKYKKLTVEAYNDLKKREFDEIKFKKELELSFKQFGLDRYYKEMNLAINQEKADAYVKRVNDLQSQWENDFDRETLEFRKNQDRLKEEFRKEQAMDLKDYSRKVGFDKARIAVREKQLAEQKRKNDQTIAKDWAKYRLDRKKLKEQIKGGTFKKYAKEGVEFKKAERKHLDEYGDRNLVQFNKSASGKRPKVQGIFKDQKALIKYTEDRDKNATGIELLNGMYKNANLLIGNSTANYLSNITQGKLFFGKQRIKNVYAELLSYTEGAIGAFRKIIAGVGVSSDQDMIRIRKNLTGIKEEFDQTGYLDRRRLIASANLIRQKVVKAARDRNKLIKTHYRAKDGSNLDAFLIKIRRSKSGHEYISNEDVNRLIGSGPKVVK